MCNGLRYGEDATNSNVADGRTLGAREVLAGTGRIVVDEMKDSSALLPRDKLDKCPTKWPQRLDDNTISDSDDDVEYYAAFSNLREVLQRDGYLLLRGVLDQDRVLKAREVIVEDMHRNGFIRAGSGPESPDVAEAFMSQSPWTEARKGPELLGRRDLMGHEVVKGLLEDQRLFALMDGLLGWDEERDSEEEYEEQEKESEGEEELGEELGEAGEVEEIGDMEQASYDDGEGMGGGVGERMKRKMRDEEVDDVVVNGNRMRRYRPKRRVTSTSPSKQPPAAPMILDRLVVNKAKDELAGTSNTLNPVSHRPPLYPGILSSVNPTKEQQHQDHEQPNPNSPTKFILDAHTNSPIVDPWSNIHSEVSSARLACDSPSLPSRVSRITLRDQVQANDHVPTNDICVNDDRTPLPTATHKTSIVPNQPTPAPQIQPRPPVCTLPYKWLRAVGTGLFTGPHVDRVYLGRNPRLLTAWIPIGDVPLEMGAMVVAPPTHSSTASPASSPTSPSGRKGAEGKGVDGHDGGGEGPSRFFETLYSTYGKTQVGRDGVSSGWISTDPNEIEAVIMKGSNGESSGENGSSTEDGEEENTSTASHTQSSSIRWVSTDFRPGDVCILGLDALHMTATNVTDRWRISCDTRWCRAGDPSPYW
ncbi:hypothetical protein HK102_007689 [Quaeritorhiza haematococci]|nr:hypothetical protein HK102_007689 [Quaeritorhiza haematococci]